jgi:hypothetical protein
MAVVAAGGLMACEPNKTLRREELTRAATSRPAGTQEPKQKLALADLVIPGVPSRLHIAWKIPEGTAVNPDAPFRLRWRASEGLATPPEDVRNEGRSVSEGFNLDLVPTQGTDRAELLGDVEIVVCDALTHKVCLPVKRHLELTFVVRKGDASAPQARSTPPELPLPEARAQ